MGESGAAVMGEESSPVHHGVPVEGHEENLTATSGTDRCKEYLEREKDHHGYRPLPSSTAAPLHWLLSSRRKTANLLNLLNI